MATNRPSCFFIQFSEQLLKFLGNFTLLKYVKSERSYGFLITKEQIFGFQILDLKDHFSASLIQNTISSLPLLPKGQNTMCLWQVYAFVNQVLLQRFENFSLIANYSDLYELLFIGLEPRMLPWKQNFNHFFVCVHSLHLFANFHLIFAHNT